LDRTRTILLQNPCLLSFERSFQCHGRVKVPLLHRYYRWLGCMNESQCSHIDRQAFPTAMFMHGGVQGSRGAYLNDMWMLDACAFLCLVRSFISLGSCLSCSTQRTVDQRSHNRTNSCCARERGGCQRGQRGVLHWRCVGLALVLIHSCS
jgi:hypothetical protein